MSPEQRAGPLVYTRSDLFALSTARFDDPLHVPSLLGVEARLATRTTPCIPRLPLHCQAPAQRLERCHGSLRGGVLRHQ